MAFQKATRKQAKLRMAIDGPSGSGKTYTALRFAFALAAGEPVAVIDTERKSASKYVGLAPDGIPWEFDVLELDTFHPQRYIDGIREAEQGGYAVLVIDSLSHAWEGEGGVLDLHDQAVKRQKVENSFTAWKDITPIHRSLVDAMLQSKLHVICTMRSKMDYAMSTDDRGRTSVKKLGLAPIQRAGTEYEFDLVGDMDIDHNLVISKSRCPDVADAVVSKPSAKWFAPVIAWLQGGSPAAPPTEFRQPEPIPIADPPQADPSDDPEPSRDEAAILADAHKRLEAAIAAKKFNREMYEAAFVKHFASGTHAATVDQLNDAIEALKNGKGGK